MATIKESRRLVKRAMLTNLVTNKADLAITPLLSGKHGIGKSQLVKSIAADINGICYTIEGGTLKEGEITGLPYQYNDGIKTRFKFLPYYVVENIQMLEEEYVKYQDASVAEKIELIKTKMITPVVIFIDEINRTESAVYKELMNILLTRSVNGYQFPWWVFFVGAMNPATQNSVYATNEMDPAQLDRFLKIKVRENVNDWMDFAFEKDINVKIVNFIAENPNLLSVTSKELEDEEKPSPSPRAWDMIDSLISSSELVDIFFSKSELKYKDKDLKELIACKIGSTTAAMYQSSLVDTNKLMSAEELFDDSESISEELMEKIKKQSSAKKTISANLVMQYIIKNIEEIKKDRERYNVVISKTKAYLQLLDSSNRLLFGQRIIKEHTASGKPLFSFVGQVFAQDILDLLEFSNENENVINKI